MRILLCILFVSSSLFATTTSLLLVRHGQTDWNLQTKAQGHSDIPLNQTGQQQAKEIAQKLKAQHPDVAAIYSSTLTRAYQTALESAKAMKISHIKSRKALRELSFGEAEGLTLHERKKRYTADALPPGAEPIASGIKRTKQELIQIAQNHPDEKVIVFGHGKVFRALASDIRNEELPPLPNCAIIHILYDHDKEPAFA